MCGKVNGMDNELQTNYTTEQTYHSIRHSIVSAKRSLSAAVNSAMVTAYWEIGEQIYKACGENDRAGYGKKLLQHIWQLNLERIRRVKFAKDAPVLLRISNSRHTVSRIELVALPTTDAGSQWERKSLLCGRMREIRVERPAAWTADPHDVLSAHLGKPG